MIRKLIVIVFIAILPLVDQAQEKCFFLDNDSKIAYSTIDSSLFTGTCSSEFKNGQLRYFCEYNGGIIQQSKRWNKKGILIDSTLYLDGYKRQRCYRFYETGELQEEGTSYLSDKQIAGMDVYENEGIHISYWKNGQKKVETKYYKGQKKEFATTYYENGNLKTTGLYVSDQTESKAFESFKADSIHTEYRENGTLEMKTTYAKGKKQGLTVYFNEDGTIYKEEEYKDGLLIK